VRRLWVSGFRGNGERLYSFDGCKRYIFEYLIPGFFFTLLIILFAKGFIAYIENDSPLSIDVVQRFDQTWPVRTIPKVWVIDNYYHAL
jgi:hypothetical protein